MANGPADADLFVRAANRVDQVLKDPRQADQTIMRSTQVELIVNLGTAQALALTIPPSILDQATEVRP
jgi:putative tryptophan/tyrosine transport system substrate-binding protein